MEGLRHKGYVRSLAFSRDGRFLLSGGQEGSLILWDLQAGRALARRRLPWKEGLFSASLSPRGDRILCGGDKGGLLLMDTGTGRILARPAGHRERVWTVGFGPKGRLAASGSRDRTARVWDLERGTCLSVLRGHGSSVRGVRFSPDGKRLATTGVDGIFRLWSVPEGRLLRAFPSLSPSTLYQVFFAGPGRLLSSDHDGRLLLLDSRAGKVEEIGRSAEAALGLDLAPGKGLALLAAMDGKVRLFDLPGRFLLWESLKASADYYSAAISAGEERIAAGRDDGGIFLSRLGWARREARLRAEAERLRALLRERPDDKEAALKLALLYAGRGGFLPAARTALDLERRGALPARVEFALAFREAGFPGKAREILRRIGRARPLSVYERLLEAALERDLPDRKVPKGGKGR